MELMSSEWQDRLEHWLVTLKKDFYRPLGELRWEACRTTAHLTLQEASALSYEPVETGYTWGNTYEYCWFRTAFSLPQEAAGRRIVLNLKPGGESCLFVNGQEFGTYRADWVFEKHHYMEDNTLTRGGKAGEHFDVSMETYAGQYYPESELGGCATGPVLPGDYQDPLPEGKRRTLGACTFGIWNEDAYQLYMDVMTLGHLLRTLDAASLRAAEVAEALEQFTLDVDFEQDEESRIADYKRARAHLAPVLAKKNGSTAPVFYAIGHAHLDLAWLWPVRETEHKTERTFAAQLRHMEEYPDYKFIQSEPAAYEMCRKYYPALFDRILEKIKDGQWIAEGAMWVEPDTNMPAGESLVRQLLYGKRYYKDVLGVDSEILWLPDTFGYSAALPQLLQKSGVRYLVTQKIFWSYNKGEEFPYHYFYWQGMDGTKVTSFLPTSYTYPTDPETLNNVWKDRRQAHGVKGFLIPYGYGDGGGGPARDYIEYVEREKDLEGCVKVVPASPTQFFTDMEAQGGPQETWRGELYFSAHRGTYTAQAMVKENNRRTEFALRRMELLGALAQLASGEAGQAAAKARGTVGASAADTVYPYERAEALWKRLLFLQFHDILPGSSITKVYEEAEQEFIALQKEIAQVTETFGQQLRENGAAQAGDAASGRAAADGCVTVLNQFSFARKALVELPNKDENGVSQEKQGAGSARRVLVSLPPLGTVVLPQADMAGQAGASNAAAAQAGVSASGNCAETGACGDVLPLVGENAAATVTAAGDGFVMENALVRLLVDARGEITSFKLKADERIEFAAAPMNRLRLFRDVPRKFDAWDIDSNYVMQELPGAQDVRLRVLSAEGAEAALRIEGIIGHSAFCQTLRLQAGARRVEVEMEIDWTELHRLLKVSFPTAIYADEALNEIQYGYVRRPTHKSRAYGKERFEVCNHRYTALCDGARGAAVLNSSKYGVSMDENAIELSLLTASAAPEMRADNRKHSFRYAFTAWTGTYEESDVVEQGYDFNDAPVVLEGRCGLPFAYACDCPNVFLDAVKPAEDRSGDLILRFYEAKNMPCTAKISLTGLGIKKVQFCDLLENSVGELTAEKDGFVLPFGNFEVQTVRISR